MFVLTQSIRPRVHGDVEANVSIFYSSSTPVHLRPGPGEADTGRLAVKKRTMGDQVRGAGWIQSEQSQSASDVRQWVPRLRLHEGDFEIGF